MDTSLEKLKQQTYYLVREAITKLFHSIVLPKISSTYTLTNKWLHLQTLELPEINQHIIPWRNNIFLPLRLYIYLHYKDKTTLLEQWKLTFDACDNKRIEVATLNKRLVSLFRSVYAFLRLLPSYKISKNMCYFSYKFATSKHSHILRFEDIPFLPLIF